MVKLLHLDYIALLIYFLMIVTLLLRSNKAARRLNMFGLVLGVATISTIYDICAVSLDNSGSGAVILKYILHSGYLILRNFITPVFGAYVISITDTWHALRNRKILGKLIWIPFGTIAVLTLSSPFTHLIFYINNEDQYTRGPLFFLLYISAVFYTVFCVYHATKYIRVLTIDSFIPLISIAPSQMAAVAVQFVRPDVLCEMLATALCLLFLMLTVEKPSGKVDSATGMLRPHAFIENYIKASIVKKPLSIILINITNFAALNGYLSHTNMDYIYKAINRRIAAVELNLPAKPEIYHLENGLYAVVLSGESIPLSARYARYILDVLNHPVSTDVSNITLSINVCVIKSPDDIDNIDAFNLISKEFRKFKYSGEVIMASSISKGIDFAVMANMDKILKTAIENNQFEVYYQPIYSTKEKRFNSAEALIRLKTKEYGFIRPDLFIPMAEESGAIHKIGMIVFEQVCQFISSDDFKRLNVDYIEVNLSIVQCMERDLDLRLLNVMKKYGVKPSQINLELTETASEFTQKNLMSNVNTLHTAGISFSLDDFGTGYSNMVRIASLPLHIVKLDKSFTWTRGNEDLKLALENTISMVKKMDMHIVVEGVEDKDMLDYFTDLECDYIQGYYFSKPLPRSEFVAYVQQTWFDDK